MPNGRPGSDCACCYGYAYLCGVRKEFVQFIERHRLCTREGPTLVAVSGGLDSMVLLDLFLQSGFNVAVAHANFQLRGEESQRDEDFVRSYCREKQLPFYGRLFATEAFAKANHLSIQMAARELRYDWFAQLAKEFGFRSIATAHQASDFAETVILNLTHQAGLHGLTGIPLRNGLIVRPLLFAGRDDIERYAADEAIRWREDESNSGLAYERNKIRHRVVPVLKEINPSLESTLRVVAERAQGDLAIIELGLMSWRERHVSSQGEGIKISKNGIAGLTHPAQLLFRLLDPFGFNYSQCVSLLAALDGQSGKFFFSTTHQVLIDREFIIVDVHSSEQTPITIAEGQAEIANGQETLQIEKTAPDRWEPSPLTANLDADTLQFPLTWRRWTEGDRFVPLGMEHSKKVSDFLIDQKVSRLEKGKVSVLESKGKIIWLVGYRIDDRFKVTEGTRSVLRISLSNGLK